MHYFLFVKIKKARTHTHTHKQLLSGQCVPSCVCVMRWPGGWCRWRSGAAAAAGTDGGGATGTAGVSLGFGEEWEQRRSALLYTHSVRTVPPPHLCSPPPPDWVLESAWTPNSQLHLWQHRMHAHTHTFFIPVLHFLFLLCSFTPIHLLFVWCCLFMHCIVYLSSISVHPSLSLSLSVHLSIHPSP